MILTYDAYSEILESEKQKEDKLTLIEERFNNMQSMLEKLVSRLGKVTDQQQVNIIGESLVSSGVLKIATETT